MWNNSCSVLGKMNVHIRRRLGAGLLLLIPMVITYLILRFLFVNIDALLQPFINEIFGRNYIGAGLVALILIVYIVGILGTNFLGSWIIRTGEWLVMRLPFVRAIYGTSKQLMVLFSGDGPTGFKRVVAVEFPRAGVWSLGFLTGMTTDQRGQRLAVVFIPTSPLPNSGYVNFIPSHAVYDLDMSVQAAMSLVLSGGIISPNQFRMSPLSAAKDSSISRGE
jgi:uncharacterized membrane protein